MRSGTIELGSGRWHWTVLAQWTGATVVFQHRDRVHDEMRSWTPETELSAADALELALDPIERVWMDVDGLKWRLSLELPSTWRTGARDAGVSPEAGKMWLVFRRGGFRMVTEVSEGTRLGGFTHQELRELLDRAFRSDRLSEA